MGRSDASILVRPMMAELCRRAKARMKNEKGSSVPRAAPARPAANPKRLLHELQVHQIELEMQNEELQEARNRSDSLLEKYTDLYDFAPVGYLTLDTHGRIHLLNLTAARLVGVDRSSLVGQSFGQLIVPECRTAFHSLLKRVFAEQAKQTGDFKLSGKGRSHRAVNIEAQRSPNGQDCRVMVVDITERRRVEDSVRISEIRYRRLFEAAHDGVLLIDPATGKITDANPFMTQLLGYSHDKLVGKELFEIGLLKDEAASREMFRKLKKNHEVRYEDLPLESQVGRHQEVEVVANLYLENDMPVIQCNIRDITERKHSEELLKRNEALFGALVNQVPVGVFVMDADLRLMRANPKAMPVFRKVHPLVGRNLAEIMRIIWPARVAARIVEHFRHTLKTGVPYISPGFSERRRDTGVIEYYEWQIQRVTLPAGEHGVVCFFNDVTSRKQAEEVRRRMDVLAATNRKLEREIVRRHGVEKSLTESEQHLTRLLGQSQLLHRQLRYLSQEVLRVQEDERKRISRELHDVIAQMLTGINIRLATLKTEAGRGVHGFDRSLEHTRKLIEKSVDVVHCFARELRPAVLDDLGLIPALHSFLKDFTEKTGVHTHLTAFAGVEQMEIAKRTVLFRVAQEALANVAQHAKAGRVEVKMGRTPAGMVMKIKDDGKSFNVEQAMQVKRGGRLGLLGMRERLEMVGGKLSIDSMPGKGTAINVEMPFGKARSGGKKPKK